MKSFKDFTKNEILLFAISIILLVLLIFSIDNNYYQKQIIKNNNTDINAYQNDIIKYEQNIDSLNEVLKDKKKIDTIIKIKYKERIESVYVYKYNDYINFYDTILNTNILQSDTFICFDSISMIKITERIVKGQRDSELLVNCNIENNLNDIIINLQDSIINMQDTIYNATEKNYNIKIKKIKKQRNRAIGVSIVEFLLLFGIIVK